MSVAAQGESLRGWGQPRRHRPGRSVVLWGCSSSLCMAPGCGTTTARVMGVEGGPITARDALVGSAAWEEMGRGEEEEMRRRAGTEEGVMRRSEGEEGARAGRSDEEQQHAPSEAAAAAGGGGVDTEAFELGCRALQCDPRNFSLGDVRQMRALFQDMQVGGASVHAHIL